MLPSPTRIEYAAPSPARRTTAAAAFLPAALAVEMMSIWMSSGLALASHAFRLSPLGLVPGGARSDPGSPSPIPSAPERGSYRISSPPFRESSSPVM